MPPQTDPQPVPGQPPREPQAGDMLGAYRLDALAGEGGMGRVFSATHTRLDKRVAVKVLRRRYARREEAVARFFQEARAVNLIRHPHIVEITDFVEAPPGGDSYYIMEWLEGDTLAARLASDRTIPADLAIHVGRQVASALAAVHQAGLVHRDLKPDNIFLVEHDGTVDARILDFGVAMLQGESDGVVAGTPAYFSPEGAAGRALDGRSDIYALGVVLYEALSGALPLAASSLSEYVMKHMTARPRPLAQVARQPLPPGLAAIVDRCLAKDPEERFASMGELEQALAALSADPSTEGGAPRWRQRALALAVTAAAALLASLLTLRLIQDHRQGAAATVASVAAGEGAGAAVVEGRAPAAEPARMLSAAPLPAVGLVAPEPTTPADSERIEMVARSEPQGAEVYGDGILLGVTPCTLHLPPRHQTLTFKRAGYRPRAVAVEPTAGGLVSAHLAPSGQPAAEPELDTNRAATINPFR